MKQAQRAPALLFPPAGWTMSGLRKTLGHGTGRMYRVWSYITNYSILLIAGALIALIWANVDAHSYHHFIEYPLWFNSLVGVDMHHWTESFGPAALAWEVGDVERVITVHYLINDLLMAFFFAIAAKEVWEAVILRNGSLRGRKAATPLVATAGGMVGPIAVYLGLASAGSSLAPDTRRCGSCFCSPSPMTPAG